MLKRLHLKNFTVFADADFEFGPGLNVLVGTNGTGKSHVLKVGYAIEMARYRNKDEKASGNIEVHPKEDNWSSRLFYNLPDVFQTAGRKQLVAVNSRLRTATVELEFNDGQSKNEAIKFEISAELDDVRVSGGGEIIGEKIEVSAPVFIPAKEILTLSWILPASEQLIIPVEQNYLHLLNQLRLLPLRKPKAAQAIQSLTDILGGEVQEQGDKYFLEQFPS